MAESVEAILVDNRGPGNARTPPIGELRPTVARFRASMAHKPSSSSAQAAEQSSPGANAADLTRGLTRKIMFAALFGGLVFAALALYGDVSKLKAAASEFSSEAVLLGFALAAGNYAIRVVRWHYYLRCLDIFVPVGESALVFLSGFVMSVTPGKVGEVFKSLLLFESLWKLIWLAVVALPLAASGDLSGEYAETLVNCLFVVPVLIAVPWGYVWRTYVREPGEAWR